MQHTATYLDSGFYLITDRAAGQLVKVLGKKLPRFGYEMRVNLAAGDGAKPFASAWLQRTTTRLRKPSARGWHWALYGFTAIPGNPQSGHEFDPLKEVRTAGTFYFHPSA